MTLPSRILAELAKGEPLTATALARALLPHADPARAANQIGGALRRLRARSLVRSCETYRAGRGKLPLAWTATAGAAASAARAAGRPRRVREDAGAGLAHAVPRGRVHVPPEEVLPVPYGSWIAFGPPLHPDTSPDAIAQAQRRDVAAYLAEAPRAPVEEIAAAADMPADVVTRRLAELRGAVAVAARPGRECAA